MDREKFEAADSLVDEIANIIDEILASEKAELLKKKLAELSKAIGSELSIGLDCRLEVFDSERERSLPLLSTGLSSSGGQPPYRTWGDSSPQRYLVKGEMMVAPHDHCPACWGVWDFKMDQPVCGECGIRLGDEVKILLDSDVCPHCEKGKVGVAQPKCSQCGFEVNLRYVDWG